MAYWLMKSEPDTFSIDDLEKAVDQKSTWEGVRNYQARNFMRDQMQVKDLAFFYHSNATIPGIVGLMEITRLGLPDPTSWDLKSAYYDPLSTPEKPRWWMVEVQFLKKFDRILSLQEIKEHPELKDMLVAQRGQRLSIQPVKPQEFESVLKVYSINL